MNRPASPTDHYPAWLGAAVVLALGLLLFFWKLGAPGLIDPDEPYYAVPALEMLRTGTWRVPLFHGAPWFDKPIFYYWTVLAGYHVLGVTELAARFGSALSALLGALSLFLWRRDQPLAALGGAIVLSTSILYVAIARIALTDATLTLFVTLSMLAFARHLETRSRLAALGGGVAIGLAVLTKGPVGLLLPGMALLAYSIFTRSAAIFRPRALGFGALGLAATAAPWYAYMMVAHRDLLVGAFLEQGNMGRFLSPEHPAFPFYYAVILLTGLLPWSGALPAALLDAVLAIRAKAERGRSRVGPVYLLCWLGAVVFVFSCSASKLPTYVLPACPPAALLIGGYWTRVFREDGGVGKRGASFSGALSAAIAGAMLIGLVVVGRKPQFHAAATPLVVSIALLLCGTLLSLFALRRRTLPGFTLSLVGATVASTSVLVVFAVPALEPIQSTRGLVRALERKGVAKDIVGSYHVIDIGLDFYLDRTVPRVDTPAALHEAVRQTPHRVWVIGTSGMRSLSEDTELTVETLELGPRRCAVRLGTTPGTAGGEER
jgi:4-amino-4-deoxy-L-arabinose transferase-like glycosyltransferase